jgi:cell division protein FtsB
MEIQDFLKTKWATWVLLAVLALGLVGFARVYFQKHKIDKEIAKLQERADKINRDNEQLSYLIQYFNTPEYQEKQAREKLNLKKEGEYVLGLPESNEQDENQLTASEQYSSNAKQWFNYFFHSK